ncbi:MAG: DUF6491 family protein [Lysobacterales bacterium]
MNKQLILLSFISLGIAGSVVGQEDTLASNGESVGTQFDMVIGQDDEPRVLGGGDANQVIGDAGQRNQAVYGEPLKKLWVPNISSWTAIDDQRLVLYTSPFRPYLLTLNRKAAGLQFDQRVSFQFDNNHIYANFDRIVVDGFPYTIAKIEKLDRDTARALARRDKGSDAPPTTEADDDDEKGEIAEENGES